MRFFKPYKYLIILLLTIFIAGSSLLLGFKKVNTPPSGTTKIDKCNSIKNEGQKKQCFQDLLKSELKENGLVASFSLLGKLYVQNQDLSGVCHGLTHTLGQEAYNLFKENKDFSVPPSVSYCNYGFYHGFMEVLLTRGGDISEAKKFCGYIDKQLGSETPDAPGQCYHGIGHGNAGIHDKRYWGNADYIIEQGLKLCEKVSETWWDQLYRCASGVYNAISDFHTGNEFGFSMSMIDPKDPLKLCREQPLKYRAACYGNIKSIFEKVTKRDFKKAVDLIEAIPDKDNAISTMWYISGYFLQDKLQQPKYFSEYITICRSSKPYLHLPCINGLVSSFLFDGTPEIEYKEALEFCRQNKLLEEEENTCYKEIIRLLPSSYSSEKVKEICASDLMPGKWREECSQTIMRRKK